MIQFLIDTNIILWLSENNPRIDKIKSLLLAEETQIFVSAVSWWEIVIKKRTGKLELEFDEIFYLAKNHNFLELPVTNDYMKAYLELPQLHRDPFDHMLLAQAITCPMRLITSDSQLAEYSSLVMVI